MLAIVKSMSLHGLDGYLIDVQVDVSSGLPHLEIVGLPDTSIKESKERVRTAIKNSEFEFPSRRIVVNLAPADTRKEGAFFDLPIAIGILNATENIVCENIEKYIFIGELSLDGKMNKVNGILPMCIEAKKLGINKIILPKENAKEASVVQGLDVMAANTLLDVIKHLNGEKIIEPFSNIDKNAFTKEQTYKYDFSDVKGQENIKRALEVSAAGGHNCLLIGSPGSRKNNDGKKATKYIARFDI